MTNEKVKRQAQLLAKANMRAEPSISKVYWFPDDHEVRLVELDSQVPTSGDGRVHPYFFRPSPENQLPAPSGVAIINPQEYSHAALPEEWGTWDDAVEIGDVP